MDQIRRICLIHYHGIPLTPAADMVKSFATRHAMVSFAHPEQITLAAEICQSVILDNGAFSAWKSKHEFDVNGYAKWVEHWQRHPAVDWHVIPDVIDGNEKDNDDMLTDWPLDGGVPVYHLHESINRLERLMSFPRIALGSSGQWSNPGSREWWNRISEIASVLFDENGFPYTKLHGLRMLDPVIFSHLPLSSADSCNVARNVGIDQSWNGPYAPRSRSMRALILMDRIERHATARNWCGSNGVQQNFDLLG